MKKVSLVTLVTGCFAVSLNAQQNKLIAGIIGMPVPFMQWSVSNIGYERLNKKRTHSVQINFSYSGNTIGIDASTIRRKWITLEQKNYFKKAGKRFSYFCSFFCEFGTYKDIANSPIENYKDSSFLRYSKYNEINPGILFGTVYHFSKKFNLEIGIGPKIKADNGKEYFQNFITRKEFSKPYKQANPDHRFYFSFSYQF